MKILLTFDYELFFGTSTGTPYKCMIKPTNELIKIAERHNIRYSFFIDCGYIIKLEQYQQQYKNLADDYKNITGQIKYLAAKGHDVQLHIHPHWEDTHFDGNNWVINTSRYRLHQFSAEEISDIFKRYSEILVRISGQPIHTYRAGGWCLQPFEMLKGDFVKTGIKMDSSVFKEGHQDSGQYFYDFRNCPKKDWWRFENNPAEESDSGKFIEIPISSMKVSPLFYWKLYLLGRINPARHKPIGDGKPILTKGYKKNILSRYTRQPVSTDGYNARLLYKQTLTKEQKNGSLMVIIGHPKALSVYSLETLDQYIFQYKNKHSFITYSDLLPENSLFQVK